MTTINNDQQANLWESNEVWRVLPLSHREALQKVFAEMKEARKEKLSSSYHQVSEIVCTQEDIGEPNDYSLDKK